MNKLIQNIFTLFLLIGVFVSPNNIFAYEENALTSADISFSTIPENPKPYEDVTIKLTSYATDLNKAQIEWRVNSKTVLSDYGKTSYTLKTGPSGTFFVVEIIINPYDSSLPITKKILINPSEIETLWESVDGYTPPFYKGKSFPSSGGLIKVVALPNTNNKKNSIVYTWKLNDNTVQSASGYNQDSYVFKNDELQTKNKVSVTASSVNSNYNATQSVEVPLTSPKILFYKKSPTEGILYNNSLGSEYTMTEDEMTVVAEPYFLSIKGKEGIFSYLWTVNGEQIETPSNKTELTVRPTSRGGYANIILTLENMSALFQKVSSKLKLNL